MNDLGPEARSILQAARGAEAPTRADRQRIKHAVLLRVATLGAVSTTAGGAVAMSLATKVTVAALTVAVLGGGSVTLLVRKDRAAPPVPVASAREPSRTLHAGANRPVAAPEAPAVVEESRPKPVLPEVRRREVARPELRPAETVIAAESAPASVPALNSLDPELTVLRQAQEDLRAGLPAQALRRLSDYDRRFGKGALEQERRAIEAIALCQVHPGPAAQAQAGSFLRAAPESPLAERVRSACKKSDETAKQSNGIPPGREP
ncbi:MAG TPA: hypothetical protein VJ860_07035 [Polyangia bacterium]|jgi:hypothetical protein|nr:hypothetical protein [Polyangia bacterium]